MIFKGSVKSETQELSGTTQSGKDWVKKDFVIEETEGEYPNSVVLTNFNNKVSIKVGDVGEFHINSRVNEYNGKYYNSLNLWKIELDSATVVDDVNGQIGDNTPPPSDPVDPTEDGLPF